MSSTLTFWVGEIWQLTLLLIALMLVGVMFGLAIGMLIDWRKKGDE